MRRLLRSLATVGLVLATSTGLVLTTSGTAHAWELQRGPADKLALKMLLRGSAAAGAAAKSPGTIVRIANTCKQSGTLASMCATSVAAAIAAGAIAYDSRAVWMPWAEDFFLGGGDTEVDPGCVQINGIPCQSVGILSFGTTPTATNPGVVAWTYTRASPHPPINISVRCSGTPAGSEANGYRIANPDDFASRTWPIPNPCTPVGATVTEVKVTSDNRAIQDGLWGAFTPHLTWTAPTAGSGEVTTSLSCRNPDTGEIRFEHMTALPYEGAAPLASCPLGWDPESINMVGPNGTTEVDLKAPASDARDYPLCAASACLYRIYIDGKPCVIGDADCADWLQVHREDPGAVDCRYGTYVIDLALCHFMEDAYIGSETTVRVVTKTNTDGDPETKSPTRVATPVVTRTPRPTTTATPTVTGTPTATPTVTPTVRPPVDECLNGGPACTPVTDPNNPDAEVDACWPKGFGVFNPANWVLQPIKCGWRWALVPPPGSITKVQTDVSDAWNDSAMGKWGAAMPDLWGNIGDQLGGSGCSGPPLPTGVIGEGTGIGSVIYPFSACPGDHPAKVKAAQISFALGSFAVSFFGGMKCVNIIGTAFGFVPPLAARYASYGDVGHYK